LTSDEYYGLLSINKINNYAPICCCGRKVRREGELFGFKFFLGGNDMKRIYTQSPISFLLIALCFFLAIPAQAQASDFEVDFAAICANVIDREPVGAGRTFNIAVGKLYCFTKIVGAETPTTITHVWYYGDTERASVTLSVRSMSWRTQSSKILQAHEVGPWHVDVLAPSGKILRTIYFNVVQ
jgi:hypothetical protein